MDLTSRSLVRSSQSSLGAFVRAWVTAVTLCLGLAAADVRGEQPSRIALVHEQAADARAIGRLKAELLALGLQVIDVPRGADATATPLDDTARRVDAFAAVHVVPDRGGVEVWVGDREGGRTLVHERVIGPGGVFDDVLALQAAEIVRATLVDLGLGPKPEVASPEPASAPTRAEPPPPPSPPPVPRVERRLVLELGPGVSPGRGGLGPAIHGFVGGRFRPAALLGVDVWGLLSVAPANVEAPGGSADVRPSLVGIGAAIWPFDPGSDFQLAGGGGVALAYLSIDGTAEPPLLARKDSMTVALPFLRLSFGGWLASRVGVGASAFAGIAMPRPAIRFDAREVAEWGRPVIVGVLTCDVALD